MMDPATWLAMVTSGWSDVSHTAFWVALLKIMWINILLSGDNAVVIAMACRGLPHRQRVWGMIVGAVVATDPVIQGYLEPRFGAEGFHYITLFAALVGAVLVLLVGGLWRRSKLAAHAERVGVAE